MLLVAEIAHMSVIILEADLCLIHHGVMLNRNMSHCSTAPQLTIRHIRSIEPPPKKPHFISGTRRRSPGWFIPKHFEQRVRFDDGRTSCLRGLGVID
jgi:hypothetical protein